MHRNGKVQVIRTGTVPTLTGHPIQGWWMLDGLTTVNLNVVTLNFRAVSISKVTSNIASLAELQESFGIRRLYMTYKTRP